MKKANKTVFIKKLPDIYIELKNYQYYLLVITSFVHLFCCPYYKAVSYRIFIFVFPFLC